MKKNLIAFIKNEIEHCRKGLADDTISDTQKAEITNRISGLETILKETEKAADTENSLAEVQNKLAAMDEKFAALAEKVKTAPSPQPSANYLATEEAKMDFGKVLRNSILNHSDFTADWKRHCESKGVANAITFTNGEVGALYPEIVRSKIHDLWNADTNWLNLLNNTRAKRFGVRYTSQAQDNTDVRAKGHQKGATKTDQSLTIDSFIIDGQMVYKILPVDRITEFYDDGALVDFVVDELFRQFKYEVARCVLVGDGRLNTDPDRITSFAPVGRTTTDAFVTVAGRDTTKELVEDLVALLENIGNKEENDVVLFISESDLNVLRKRVYGSGGTIQYVSREEVASQLGVSRIVTSGLIGSANTFDYQAIAFIPALYATVGDFENPELESFHDFRKNQDNYRIEAVVGGAPEGLKMGAVLTPAP